MAYRDHWSAEGLSEITNTTTTYSDLVSLTHTAANQVASADYVLFWSAAGKINVTTVDYNLRLLKDGSPAVLVNNEQSEVASPEDYDAQGGMLFYTAASTPVDVAFKIQLAVETATNTGKAKDGRLNILKLGANDKFATSVTRVTTTSGTFQDSACTITFTPPSSGDYILIATALMDVNPTTGSAKFRISDGTNLSGEMGLRGIKDTTSRTAGMIIWRQNAVSGSKTYTVQYNSDNGDGATVGISEMRLLILRVADFDAVHFDALGADSAGTQTTYTTLVSETFTPSGNDHFTLASWRFGNDTNTISSYVQFLDGSDVVAESIREPTAAAGRWMGLGARIATYPASSRTMAIQRKSETSGASTNVIEGAAFASFDLGLGAQTLTPSLFTNSNTFYAPTVAPGSVTLTPGLFTSAPTFYAATVSQGGTQTLTPSLFTNTNTFYSPTVTPGAVTLTPSLFTNSSTFYAATVTRGTITLTPGLFTNSSTFYAATVTKGAVTLSPALFTNASVFYSPTVALASFAQTLLPSLFANDNTFYAATITGGEETDIPDDRSITALFEDRAITARAEDRSVAAVARDQTITSAVETRSIAGRY